MAKVLSIKPPSQGGITKPTEGVEIELGDGVKRELRYSIKSLKVLKEHFTLGKWDDSDIPRLIWLGLAGDDGSPPLGVTLEDLENLGIEWREYLGAAFVAAYTGAMPPPKEVPEEKKAPAANPVK